MRRGLAVQQEDNASFCFCALRSAHGEDTRRLPEGPLALVTLGALRTAERAVSGATSEELDRDNFKGWASCNLACSCDRRA